MRLLSYIRTVFCFIFVLSVHTILFAATEGRVTYDFEPSADELPIMHSYVSEYAFIDVEAVADVFDLQYQVDDAYDNAILRKKICKPPKTLVNGTLGGIFRLVLSLVCRLNILWNVGAD